MFKNKNDVFFGFCLTFIIFLALYLGFQRSRSNYLEKYLHVIHDKISTMVSEEDKEALNRFFTDFVKGLKDNTVSPAEVEQLVENVMDLRKQKKILSRDDLDKLLRSVKSDSPARNSSLAYEYSETGNWQKWAASFEKSLARCDSIRMHRNEIKQLYRHLKDQIEIHAQISDKIKLNSLDAMRKFDEFKKREMNSEIEQQLLQELERLKLENKQIQNKLSHMDEIKSILQREKRILHKKMQQIDSLKSAIL